MQALISPKAKIGKNVQFGYGVHIYDDVEIEDDVRIGDYCEIGHMAAGEYQTEPVHIGQGAVIRSHTVIYQGSTLGAGLETGHHVIIREGTAAGLNLRVGNFSDIEGRCTLGDYVRLHGYVHVGQGSRVGDFVRLYSLVTLTNDPLPPSDILSPVVIEAGVVVCVAVTLLPGSHLKEGCYIAANSMVEGEIPAGAVVAGIPGRITGHVSQLMSLEHGKRHPWMSHFRSGYPEGAWPRLEQLGEAILASRHEFLRDQQTELARRGS